MINFKYFYLSNRGIFFVLTVISFLIRIAYVLSLEIDNPIRGDATYYVQYAQNLFHYGVFSKSFDVPPVPDSYWGPGYPVFLALIFLLSIFFGVDAYNTILVCQALLGAGVCLITFRLGRLVMPRRYALIAAILTAFSPHLISHGGYILTEGILPFIVVLALNFLVRFCSSTASLTAAIYAGIALSAGYLVNPVVAIIPFFLGVFQALTRLTKKQVAFGWRPSGALFGLFLLVVMAWGLRGYLVVKDGSDASGRAFQNFVFGAHSDYHEIWRNNPRDPTNPADLDNEKYRQHPADFLSVFFTRVAEKPAHYAKWYFIDKPLELWGWDVVIGQGDIFVYPVNSSLFHKSAAALVSYLIMKHLHYWILTLSLVGLIFVIKDWRNSQSAGVEVIYIFLLAYSSAYILLQTDGRYSVPMRPELYLAASYALFRLIEWINGFRVKAIQ